MGHATLFLAVAMGCMAGMQAAIAEQPARANAGGSNVGGLGPAVTPEKLATQRGAQGVVVNAMDVNAKVQDTRATDTVSGNNFVGGGAFSHASGLPVAIQNSGNNVVIQNAFILNVEMK